MPSFDIVSQVDQQEVKNAIEQANKEITNRYDFKGSDARIEQQELELLVFGSEKGRPPISHPARQEVGYRPAPSVHQFPRLRLPVQRS